MGHRACEPLVQVRRPFMGGEEDFVALSTQVKSSIPRHNQGYAARCSLSPVGPRHSEVGLRHSRPTEEARGEGCRERAGASRQTVGGLLQEVAGEAAGSVPDVLGCGLLLRREVAWRVVMRTRHVNAGLRRIGIVLALILSLPLLFALWTWITLGRTPPAYVYL